MFGEKKKGIVFFDIDDTLVDTIQFKIDSFGYAIEIVIKNGFLEKYPKYDKEKILEVYNKYYEPNKNGKHHYLNTFMELTQNPSDSLKYESIAVQARHEFRDNNYKNYFRKDFLKIFEILNDMKYELGIISEGLREKQNYKIIKLEIKNKINYTYLVETKSKKIYKNIFEEKNSKKDKSLWMIGDKEEKDILFAKEFGFLTIKINKEDIHTNSAAKSEISPGNLFQIISIINNYEKLQENQM